MEELRVAGEGRGMGMGMGRRRGGWGTEGSAALTWDGGWGSRQGGGGREGGMWVRGRGGVVEGKKTGRFEEVS